MTKKNSFILLILLFARANVLGYNPYESDSGLKENATLVSKLVNALPTEALRKGVSEYVKTIDPSSYRDYNSVGSSNEGIKGYFENRFKTNSCFQNSSRDFYDELGALFKSKNPCPPNSGHSADIVKYGCAAKTLNIDESAGQGRHSDLQEGWLLALAMKHANNNLPAALELIGMCGHDDKEQGDYRYEDFSQKGRREQLAKIEVWKGNLREAEKEVENIAARPNHDPDDLRRAKMDAEAIQKNIEFIAKKKSWHGHIQCPQGKTDFFVPRSLSSAATISPDLIAKVKQVQGTDGVIIPPKQYHIYAAALLGCKMSQEGMSPAQAKLVDTSAARIYRGVRMCDVSQRLLDQREQAVKAAGSDFENADKTMKIALQAWKNQSSGKLDCTARKMDAEQESQCALISAYKIDDFKTGESHIVERKIKAAQKRMDAARLYSDWYFGGGSVLGQKLPCTNIRYEGPKDLMKPLDRMFSSRHIPTGWSKERYEDATKTLATWEVDFEWTVAQHAAGVHFGAKACSKFPKNQNPFEKPGCYDQVKDREDNGSFGLPAKTNEGVQ